MKRGEIWTAPGPDDAGKPRPVLIVQDDHFNAPGSITICLLTTQPIDASLFRIAIAPTADNGLREPCFAMADKITTMARSSPPQWRRSTRRCW